MVLEFGNKNFVFTNFSQVPTRFQHWGENFVVNGIRMGVEWEYLVLVSELANTIFSHKFNIGIFLYVVIFLLSMERDECRSMIRV